MVEISNIDKETLLNLDTEKSGQISYNGFYIMLEYVAATISKDKYSFQEKLKEVYEMIDKSNKGSFSLEDFGRFVGGSHIQLDSKDDVEFYKLIMEKALGNKSCTFEEFKAYMQK